MSGSARRPVDGFTLLELLVAITLLGLLMAALFGGLQLGTRAWETSETRLGEGGRLQVVQSFLRQRLAQAYPLRARDETGRPRVVFEGTANRLRFVTLMPERLGAGFQELTLALAEDPEDLDREHLLVRWQPFVDLETASSELGEGAQQKVLLEDVRGLELAYYGAPEPDLPPAWQEAWDSSEATPRLVRVRVEFAEDDARHWPDLVVQPMIDGEPLS